MEADYRSFPQRPPCRVEAMAWKANISNTVGKPIQILIFQQQPMDLTNPLRSVAPTVDADVLFVLARTHGWMTGSRVRQMSGRSYAQVREVLLRLADHGILDVERHGNVRSYRLNRDHVTAPAISGLVEAAAEVESRIRSILKRATVAPHAVVIFGSFARRNGDADSDIDILLVRPNDVGEDDVAWAAQRYELARHVESWTGNTAQILEMSRSELDDAVGRDELVEAVRRDGRVLFGPAVRDLLSPRRLG